MYRGTRRGSERIMMNIPSIDHLSPREQKRYIFCYFCETFSDDYDFFEDLDEYICTRCATMK